MNSVNGIHNSLLEFENGFSCEGCVVESASTRARQIDIADDARLEGLHNEIGWAASSSAAAGSRASTREDQPLKDADAEAVLQELKNLPASVEGIAEADAAYIS